PAIRAEPAIAPELRSQEPGTAQQAVGPEQQLAQREQRQQRNARAKAEIREQHLPAVALEQEKLLGEHRQVIVVRDRGVRDAPDLAAGDPQKPRELHVFEVQEAALIPAAETLEQRA